MPDRPKEGPYSKAWRRYQWRISLAVALPVLSLLPITVLALRYVDYHTRQHVMPPLVCLYLLITMGWSYFRAFRLNCPRCDSLFFGAASLRTSLRQTNEGRSPKGICVCCGLPYGAVSDDDPGASTRILSRKEIFLSVLFLVVACLKGVSLGARIVNTVVTDEPLKGMAPLAIFTENLSNVFGTAACLWALVLVYKHGEKNTQESLKIRSGTFRLLSHTAVVAIAMLGKVIQVPLFLIYTGQLTWKQWLACVDFKQALIFTAATAIQVVFLGWALDAALYILKRMTPSQNKRANT